MQNELYHYGILGQKWGVRRYQNEDGSLTNAGKKHYNYKDSDRYKNASKNSKIQQTNVYNSNASVYGKKQANKMEYRVREEHIARNKVDREMLAKALVVAGSITVAGYAAPYVGVQIANAKRYLQINNYVNGMYAQKMGLNTVKGGFSLGIEGIRNGKMFADILLNGRGGNK